MLIDLHTHTLNSFDGFTTAKQMLGVCIDRKIQVVAITEHDQPCKIDPSPFYDNGIMMVSGCEYTNEKGAHIIGLFVKNAIRPRSRSKEILDHIHNEGGIAIMPHPMKPCSGYLALECEENLVQRFDFIEILNGGFASDARRNEVVKIANQHGLRMIGSSDAHKMCQVGLCCTALVSDISSCDIESTKDTLKNIAQHQIQILYDQNLLLKNGRRTSITQKSFLYQRMLQIIPIRFRRLIKLINYKFNFQSSLARCEYNELKLEGAKW